METKYLKLDLPKPHRRPDRHRYDPPFWRWALEFLFVVAVAVLIIAAAEGLCIALGCPTDPYAMR